MIYLDTSALAKLIVRETGTAALGQWLRQRAAQLWVTSIIGRVELVRVANRFAAVDGGHLLLAGLDTVPLIEHVADVAQGTGSATLRTLDAIHLASALSVRDELTAFCCYDRRLLDAAGDAGLPSTPQQASRQPPASTGGMSNRRAWWQSGLEFRNIPRSITIGSCAPCNRRFTEMSTA